MAKSDTSLKLDIRQDGPVAVVHLAGSAGMNEAESMRIELEELASGKVPVIILDLSNLSFICSLGLGAIISGHLRCRHHKGQIRLVNPQPAVQKLLETTRLTKLFPIYATVEQATLQGD